MSDSSDKPTHKRADEIEIGDYIHNGRGMGPVEITHVQAHRNAHGYDRVLLVTAHADASYHRADDILTLATAADLAAANDARERARLVARIREMADWLEQHTELPPPNSVELRMQHSMVSAGSTDEDKLALAAAVAESLGKTVNFDATYGKGGSVRVQHSVGDRNECELTYVLHGFLSAPAPADVKMRETPLDNLPDDFGADHKPELDCCEDCDLELDAEAEADAADAANDRAGVA